MTIWLSIVVALSAVLHLRAEYMGPPWQIYLFKPLTTALIILIALLAPTEASSFYKWAIVIGLLFSLAGDVFLMLPKDRFLTGLSSFLVAHICYIVAFASRASWEDAFLPLLPFLLAGAVFIRVLWPHLNSFRLPVLVYSLAIIAMGWCALLSWIQTEHPGGPWAFSGALLFIVSDAVLAFNRFVHAFKPAQAIIMITYFSAQLLIALSI